MHQPDDIRFMQRALDLAESGRGKVSPNPMVGCVIVHDGRVVGEGWHEKYGGPHAEVHAINNVPDKSLLPKSTCYVTLEPCAHHGQTPPCADLLIRERVGRVVIGCQDTNPLVGGQGIERMRQAGIEVVVGVMKKECRNLNRRFFKLIEEKRPYIILKWAQTQDGFIARENFDSKWISGVESRTMVHQWRAEEDAIMVGTNTTHYDNPRLNVRDWNGPNPTRVVIDKELRLSKEFHLFDRSQPTLVYNLLEDRDEDNLIYVKLSQEDFLTELMRDLHIRKVQSIIVEGGVALLNSLIDLGLWDEARVFENEQSFETGISAPKMALESRETLIIEQDKLNIYYHGQG